MVYKAKSTEARAQPAPIREAIKGGGFLHLDEAKGEYAGVLELSFKGMTVKALGLLNTKAPAPAGWSLRSISQLMVSG